MAGISIEARLNSEAAQARLQEVLGRLGNKRSLLDSIAELIMSRTSENFRNETAPDGTPWAPHSPATIRQRQARGHLPLTILRSNARGKSGSTLAGSINKVVTGDEARIGSPVVYAAIHQLGGTIQKPASSRWTNGRRFARRKDAPGGRDRAIGAHTITIPARPFIGVSAEDEEDILDLAGDWLTR